MKIYDDPMLSLTSLSGIQSQGYYSALSFGRCNGLLYLPTVCDFEVDRSFLFSRAEHSFCIDQQESGPALFQLRFS